ncbi:MAG: alkaline phosphatase family protein [Pseudomonadota bacterium]
MKNKIFAIPGKFIILNLAALLCVSWGSAGRCEALPGNFLKAVSVKPGHIHRVAAGAKTTFVLSIENKDTGMVSGEVAVDKVTEGWTAVIAEADNNTFSPIDNNVDQTTLQLTVGDNASRYLVVTATPGVTIDNGTTCDITVNATLDNDRTDSVTLQAKVNNTPKVYFIIIDACSRLYVRLDTKGNIAADNAEMLMPNVRDFLEDAARFPDARDSLPSGTDPNNYSILSGSWPGTSSVINTGYYFKGWNAEHPDGFSEIISSDELRYGQDGVERVKSIFDAAKTNDNEIFTALIAGKYHIPNLFKTDSINTVESTPTLLVTGLRGLFAGQYGPYYFEKPQAYHLGCPITDRDRGDNATDRYGVNLDPGNYKMNPEEEVGTSGDDDPSRNPSDRWIAESALRIIAAEDPDVFAIHMGNVDKMQHAAGAADQPKEWVDFGTPGILWDDINIYNRSANRDPVLDVVHEADNCTGEILTALKQRGQYEKSIITVVSDHSQNTMMTDPKMDVDKILSEGENLTGKIKKVISFEEIALLYLTDHSPSTASAIKEKLNAYTTYQPVQKEDVNPFAVITREEMLSGTNNTFGSFGRQPTDDPKRGELFSQWLIDSPVDDNSKVVWPDILVFSLKRFQFVQQHDTLPNYIGGHAGKETMNVLLGIKGPEFKAREYPDDENKPFGEHTALFDIVPTIYDALGWESPGNVDGRVLREIFINKP